MTKLGERIKTKLTDRKDPERGRESDEVNNLLPQENEKESQKPDYPPTTSSKANVISKIGLAVLLLCAVHNCCKNIIMRYVMKERPEFLKSAAVLGSEFTKFSLSIGYILLVQRRPVGSIITYLKEDWVNTLLLLVPACAYNLQTSMEYVALANLDSAFFSVLVQSKLLFTAVFAAIFLRQRLKYIQIISLVLLMMGVILCTLRKENTSDDVSDESKGNATKGIIATIVIAVSSGFASVYTEKVIKQRRRPILESGEYGLAYLQVQLALMSIISMGGYACIRDFSTIVEHGLFYKFNFGAVVTVSQSAIGGLIVASVLKYANSILKGYATALSVVLTGILSMFIFGTELDANYLIGVVNVITAIVLYNGRGLGEYACS